MSRWPPPSPLNGAIDGISSRDGLVFITPKRERIALVANGPTRIYAPLEEGSWEVWGLNTLVIRDRNGQLRADRWFDMHAFCAQSTSDLEFLRACPMPLYMPSTHELGDSPAKYLLRYPREDILEHTGGRNYFTCSFAFQIALALFEGFREIGLFGVDLDVGTPRERTVEKACVEWWMGFAEGRGVKITLPPGCKMARHEFMYGYEYQAEKHYVQAQMEELAMLAAPWESNKKPVAGIAG